MDQWNWNAPPELSVRDLSPRATKDRPSPRDRDLRSGSNGWSGFWSHRRRRLTITITMSSPRGCVRSSCDLSTGYDRTFVRGSLRLPRLHRQWLLLAFEEGPLGPAAAFTCSSTPRPSKVNLEIFYSAMLDQAVVKCLPSPRTILSYLTIAVRVSSNPLFNSHLRRLCYTATGHQNFINYLFYAWKSFHRNCDQSCSFLEEGKSM